MINADHPVYAPTAGIVYARSVAVWIESENGVSSIHNVMPLVITGQKVTAGVRIAMAPHTIHWDYEAREGCQYCGNARNLAQVEVTGGTPAGRAMLTSGWKLCQHCFGKLLSQWRAKWANEGAPRDWLVIVRSHISRRPIADLTFKGEGGLRVV